MAVGCSLRLLVSRRLADVPLVVASLGTWLVVNKPVEGPVLVRITEDHGLTMADVLVVPSAVLCLMVALRAAVSTHRGRATSPTVVDGTAGRERESVDRSS
jgi:hypothetical protein